MVVDFYGLHVQTPRVTCYLWSPWRASALEHRLFNEVRQLPGVEFEQAADETRAHVSDLKTWRQVLNVIARVLKGWQEEAADTGKERRVWRWMFEGDTDDHGYDYTGEPACLWAFLRLSLDHGNPDESEKGEDIDLNGYGLRFWPDGK